MEVFIRSTYKSWTLDDEEWSATRGLWRTSTEDLRVIWFQLISKCYGFSCIHVHNQILVNVRTWDIRRFLIVTPTSFVHSFVSYNLVKDLWAGILPSYQLGECENLSGKRSIESSLLVKVLDVIAAMSWTSQCHSSSTFSTIHMFTSLAHSRAWIVWITHQYQIWYYSNTNFSNNSKYFSWDGGSNKLHFKISTCSQNI